MNRDDHAWLDAVLADERHVDDDGFTDRVVAALPPPRRRRAGRREGAIAAGALLAGACAAWAVHADAFAALRATSVGGAAALVVVVGLALWGAVAAPDA